MELDEILEHNFGGIYVAQAHSQILKWIKDRLPKEYQDGAVLFYSPNEDKRLGFTDGFNNYCQQALKNLGIK